MSTIVIDEEVNNRTVFGIFSKIKSLTLSEPEYVVEYLELPKSKNITLMTLLKSFFGEYHGSSKPKLWL